MELGKWFTDSSALTTSAFHRASSSSESSLHHHRQHMPEDVRQSNYFSLVTSAWLCFCSENKRCKVFVGFILFFLFLHFNFDFFFIFPQSCQLFVRLHRGLRLLEKVFWKGHIDFASSDPAEARVFPVFVSKKDPRKKLRNPFVSLNQFGWKQASDGRQTGLLHCQRCQCYFSWRFYPSDSALPSP